jgi:hypothetical protein
VNKEFKKLDLRHLERFRFFVFSGLFLVSVSGYTQKKVDNAIVPIDQSRFSHGLPSDSISLRWKDLVLFTCREALNEWWNHSIASGHEGEYVDFGYLENNSKSGDFGPETKGGIRPAAQAAYSVAVALFTGVYDTLATGVSFEVALTRSVTIIKSLAKDHLSNGGIIHPWGEQWQSAQWASKVAVSGWLLWEHLQEVDRLYIQNMLTFEANRFINLTPPAANENYQVNTHAEENGWDGTGIQTACALMPLHANYVLWFDKLCEYRLTALASPADVESDDVVLSRKLSEQISGYNIDSLGALGNHGAYPHPDYMAAPLRHTIEGALFFKLANKEVPEINRFNYDLVYNNFQYHVWNHTATIYQKDGSIYWPMDVEEERRFEFITFGILDLGAQVLSDDGKNNVSGAIWEEKHTKRAVDMKLTSFVAASAYLYRWINFQENQNR